MIMEVESPEQVGYDKVVVNLAESSMRDRNLTDLGFDPANLSNLLLNYGDHRGSELARSLIASEAGGALSAADVLVTVGAAGALFLVATAVLNPTDGLVVVRPNYASNLETPRAIGADISFVELTHETGYQLDPDQIASAITPRTKLISITTPHNPTGAIISQDVLQRIVEIAANAGCWLLVDETYRELADETGPPTSTLGTNVISVSSLSKTYGVPGIRFGWITCRDQALMTTLLAGQEQLALSHSVLDTAVAEFILANRERLLPQVRSQLHTNRAIVGDWIANETRIEWIKPQGGAVCFPRFSDPGINARRIFSRLQNAGIFLGPGWWFEQEERCFRLGFGYPTAEELTLGLHTISVHLDAGPKY
jgi:aspartate/methionine/tyrosine aminotransferase